MPVVLRPYQERAVSDLREAFKTYRTALLTLPTGGGKTAIGAHIFGSATSRGIPSMFIVNRIELVKQTMEAFDLEGIDYGVIAAGFTPNPYPLMQIASIDTLKRRLGAVKSPKLIAWDECRSIAAKGWDTVFRAYPNAKHFGLDATPERLDGTGLGTYFQTMIHGPRYSELMALGNLVPFRLYAPDPPVLDKVHTSKGDFDHGEVEEIMDRPKLVGDIVSHYQRMAGGKRGLVFACSVKHSHHVKDQFNAAGIRAEHLDGESPKTERDEIVGAFRRGELDILTNVNLFSAGFDVPGVDVIIDAAPTKSVSMYLQRAGRGSRPFAGKEFCIHLDHAGNVFRHGLPDQDREWSLEGRPKRKGKRKDDDSVPICQCPECYFVYAPAPACPSCGHVREKTPRELKHEEGELRAVTAEMMANLKKAQKREVQQARTLDELMDIGRARGYHERWATAVWNTRARAADQRFESQAQSYLFPRYGRG